MAYSGVTASRLAFQENCAVCHGENLEGAAQGTSLRGDLVHGEAMADVVASISTGYVDTGMPSWNDIFSPVEIQGLAMYVLETRANIGYVTSNYDAPLEIPAGVFETEHHAFRLETVVGGLDPLPFSLAPLPDGRLLVTEDAADGQGDAAAAVVEEHATSWSCPDRWRRSTRSWRVSHRKQPRHL